MRKFLYLLTFPLLILAIQSCALKNNNDSQFYLRDQVDFGYIRKIAILPFDNLTEDKYAASRARELAITQVLSQRIFDVADKGEVDSALKDEVIRPGQPLDPTSVKRLSQRLKVQAFLMGSVDSAGENRKGASSFSEISLSLRLIDGKSALVMWRASGHGSGYSVVDRLFGLNPSDAFKVTMDLIDRLLSSIPRMTDGGATLTP